MEESILKRLVALANECIAAGYPETVAELRNVIETYDVVFGVWQDDEEPNGVGTMFIKGEATMRDIIESNTGQPLRHTVIPCLDVDQAEAIREMFGDGEPPPSVH